MKQFILCLTVLTIFSVNPTPADQITNDLFLHLRADVGVTKDGLNRVSSWQDQSGFGHHAAQGDSLGQPLFVDNVLNGKPVLRFDGLNDFFNLVGQVLTSQQYSIFAVVNDTSVGSGHREILSNWTIPNGITSVFFGTTRHTSGLPREARLTDDFGGGTDLQNPVQGVGEIVNPLDHFIFTGISQTSDALIFQDENLIASKGFAISARDFSPPYVVGRQGSHDGEYWQGDIAELLVYNAELTQTEWQQNWDFLEDKYFVATPPDPIPEPSSWVLMGIGVLGILGMSWLRRKKVAKQAE